MLFRLPFRRGEKMRSGYLVSSTFRPDEEEKRQFAFYLSPIEDHENSQNPDARDSHGQQENLTRGANPWHSPEAGIKRTRLAKLGDLL